MPSPVRDDPRWPTFIRQWRTQVLPALVLLVVLATPTGADTDHSWRVAYRAAFVVVAVAFLALMLRLSVLYRSMKDDAGR
ncbi:hypothetical protein [Aeromicrobium sp. Root472D3]|uniref:hypothetical protein n=1 Tax=Aeromicrobium sp. Root472D3 TaxID=1736540 RepID=UPI000A598193|nr:hypothetical protein [Aeromicrobium sp. Root472D3]